MRGIRPHLLVAEWQVHVAGEYAGYGVCCICFGAGPSRKEQLMSVEMLIYRPGITVSSTFSGVACKNLDFYLKSLIFFNVHN